MKTIYIFYREYARDGAPVHCIDVPISDDNIRKLKKATEQHVVCSVHAALLDIVGAISRLAGSNFSVCRLNVLGIGVVENE